MQNLTPLEKIDYILNFYIGKSGSVHDPISVYKELLNSGEIVRAEDIQMIVKKLEADGYLDFIQLHNEKYYQITYSGLLFHGYVKQDEINKRNEQIKLDEINANKRNERSLRYATWLAGFGSTGLLLWEILKKTFHCL